MDYLKIIYGANIVVAGWVGLSALFFSKSATTTVFGDAYAISEYSGNDFPKGMALFFLIWVIVLPFVIPWKYIFA